MSITHAHHHARVRCHGPLSLDAVDVLCPDDPERNSKYLNAGFGFPLHHAGTAGSAANTGTRGPMAVYVYNGPTNARAKNVGTVPERQKVLCIGRRKPQCTETPEENAQ